MEAKARSTRSVSRLVNASISAATARAAAWRPGPWLPDSGSNIASNSVTSERAVEVFSASTDSMWYWLWGNPAWRRYLA